MTNLNDQKFLPKPYWKSDRSLPETFYIVFLQEEIELFLAPWGCGLFWSSRQSNFFYKFFTPAFGNRYFFFFFYRHRFMRTCFFWDRLYFLMTPFRSRYNVLTFKELGEGGRRRPIPKMWVFFFFYSVPILYKWHGNFISIIYQYDYDDTKCFATVELLLCRLILGAAMFLFSFDGPVWGLSYGGMSWHFHWVHFGGHMTFYSFFFVVVGRRDKQKTAILLFYFLNVLYRAG